MICDYFSCFSHWEPRGLLFSSLFCLLSPSTAERPAVPMNHRPSCSSESIAQPLAVLFLRSPLAQTLLFDLFVAIVFLFILKTFSFFGSHCPTDGSLAPPHPCCSAELGRELWAPVLTGGCMLYSESTSPTPVHSLLLSRYIFPGIRSPDQEPSYGRKGKGSPALTITTSKALW